jgi:hypothetical protein
MKINGTVKDAFKKRKFNMLVGDTGDIYGVAQDNGVWITLTGEHFKDIRPRVGSRITVTNNEGKISAIVTKF